MYKIQSSVYFANCEKLKKLIERAIEPKDVGDNETITNAVEPYIATTDLIEGDVAARNNVNLQMEPPVKYLIFDFSAVYHMDTDGIKMFKQLMDDLKVKHVTVYICQFQGILFFNF